MPTPVLRDNSDGQTFPCSEKDATAEEGNLLHAAPGVVEGAAASTSAPGLGGGLMSSSWWW